MIHLISTLCAAPYFTYFLRYTNSSAECFVNNDIAKNLSWTKTNSLHISVLETLTGTPYSDQYCQQWWSLETWSRSRDASRESFFGVSVSKVSGLVSVSKDFSLGLELFVSRLCIGYFLWSFARRSSLKNVFKKWLFKIQLFKEVSG